MSFVNEKGYEEKKVVAEIESRFIPLAQLFMISFTIALLYGGI